MNGSIVVDRGAEGSACEVAVIVIAFPTRPPQQRDRIDMCPEPIEIEGC